MPDDVVLRRNDGVPAYNLAVVVDDAAQGVDQVVPGRRPAGVDAPPGPPAATCSGLPRVRYAHVPLVVGADGERLAKRHGAVTLEDLAPIDPRPRRGGPGAVARRPDRDVGGNGR